jgi:hypothetical protein
LTLLAIENLIQRRNWFRYFPEGSIEFNAILRVLAVLLLIALLIVGGTQRPAVLVSLAAILWADAALLIWWLVQMSTDLDDLPAGSGQSPEAGARRRTAAFLIAVLPSIAAALLLAPWPDLFFVRHDTRVLVQAIGLPAIGLAYIIAVVAAQRTLQRIRLGPARWTLLLHVPIVHWFAMHRLAGSLQRRIHDRASEGDAPSGGETASGGTTLADLLLVATVICWALVVLLGTHSTSLTRVLYAVANLGGIFFGTLFAIANVAMMERVQRTFVSLLRKL